MVPALFITVDKDNESANKTGRKNWERAELFLGNAAPACCQITPAHSHSLTHTHTRARTHTHSQLPATAGERGEGRRGAERRGEERRGGTAGMLRSVLHFAVQPLDGRREERLAPGCLPSSDSNKQSVVQWGADAHYDNFYCLCTAVINICCGCSRHHCRVLLPAPGSSNADNSNWQLNYSLTSLQPESHCGGM